MIIHSTRMGDIEINDEDIFRFPHGLPGFPDERSFVMLVYESGIPFYLLQSTITPELTFVLADPFEFFDDYHVKLDDEIISELGLSNDNYPTIYAIVTIPDDIKNMTANLIAPVIINQKTKTGVQVILEKTVYNTKHRLFVFNLPQDNARKE